MLLTSKLKLHAGPVVLAAVLIVLGGLWQYSEALRARNYVSGSSLAGLVVGTIAAGIIYFEILLWPRKRMRRWKLGRTKVWMAYHLWLGLATGPLAFIHSGYRFGGTFTTFLMSLLAFVLLSGIYGWIMQILIPKWMLGSLPHETIPSQIYDVSMQNAIEARRMLTVALGTKPSQAPTRLTNLDAVAAELVGASTQRDADGKVQAILVGSRQRRDPQRSLFDTDVVGDFTPGDRIEIWKQYAAVIEPFLLRDIPALPPPKGQKAPMGNSPIQTVQKSLDWFGMLRSACSPNAKPILDKLQGFVEQRHQWDAQRRAHRWLHSWIAFHASVSIMLAVLLLAHIILALRYM